MKEIQCQGEGCGRMAEQVDEDYYVCYRCGWAGSEDNPVVVLKRQVKEKEAYIKRLSEQLTRATKWAYKQVLHNDSAMMDFDDYVWGDEE